MNKSKPIKTTQFFTPETQSLYEQQEIMGWPHFSPNSVFVASIGTTWAPGAYQRVRDMERWTRRAGFTCWFEEIPDSLNDMPYVAINWMRDDAILKGVNLGFDRVCLVETDALPRPDLLLRLVARNCPVIAPGIIDPKTGETISGPSYPPGGLQHVQWGATSMLLVKATVFNCPGITFGNNTNEAAIFARMWNYGHRLMLDADNLLEVGAYPSQFASLTWEERKVFMRAKDYERRQSPDRCSPDPNDPMMIDGVYLPTVVEAATKVRDR